MQTQSPRQPISFTPTFDEKEDLEQIKRQIAILFTTSPLYLALLYGGKVNDVKEPRYGYDVFLEMELRKDFPDIVVEWREHGDALTKEYADYYLGKQK